eukprot:TRINITY_DN16146_c0_g1_i2.p1 TRINITY_DN16146_c0_g1~~TRINITY_DN16146_c0_g1_i2.p1  ORF type:complete len:1498 (-),score=421.68 TRINITY_DN16146_c0_g1_i2:90-4334(-)
MKEPDPEGPLHRPLPKRKAKDPHTLKEKPHLKMNVVLERVFKQLRQPGTGLRGPKKWKRGSSFKGVELVEWLAKCNQLSAEQAVAMGQQFYVNGYIFPKERSDKAFTNDHTLWICFIDQDPDVLNDKVWKPPPRKMRTGEIEERYPLEIGASLLEDVWEMIDKNTDANGVTNFALIKSQEAWETFQNDTLELKLITRVPMFTPKENAVFFSQLFRLLYFHASILCESYPTPQEWKTFSTKYSYHIHTLKLTLSAIAQILKTGKTPSGGGEDGLLTRSGGLGLSSGSLNLSALNSKKPRIDLRVFFLDFFSRNCSGPILFVELRNFDFALQWDAEAFLNQIKVHVSRKVVVVPKVLMLFRAEFSMGKATKEFFLFLVQFLTEKYERRLHYLMRKVPIEEIRIVHKKFFWENQSISISGSLEEKDDVMEYYDSDSDQENLEEVEEGPSLLHLDTSFSHVHHEASISKESEGTAGVGTLDLSRFGTEAIKGAMEGLNAGLIKNLLLSHNGLNTVPEFLRYCVNLVSLNLSKNYLVEIPACLVDLSVLESLDISENNIIRIPNRFCTLRHLKFLNLSRNSISSVPLGFMQLRSLEELNLSHNALEELPINFGEFGMLEFLDLSYNCIHLLPDFSEMFNLEELHLKYNKMKLPKFICEITHLKDLYLEENPIIEPPPAIWSKGIIPIREHFGCSPTVIKRDRRVLSKSLTVNEKKSLLLKQKRSNKNLEDLILEMKRNSDINSIINVQEVEMNNTKLISSGEDTENFGEINSQKEFHIKNIEDEDKDHSPMEKIDKRRSANYTPNEVNFKNLLIKTGVTGYKQERPGAALYSTSSSDFSFKWTYQKLFYEKRHINFIGMLKSGPVIISILEPEEEISSAMKRSRTHFTRKNSKGRKRSQSLASGNDQLDPYITEKRRQYWEISPKIATKISPSVATASQNSSESEVHPELSEEVGIGDKPPVLKDKTKRFSKDTKVRKRASHQRPRQERTAMMPESSVKTELLPIVEKSVRPTPALHGSGVARVRTEPESEHSFAEEDKQSNGTKSDTVLKVSPRKSRKSVSPPNSPQTYGKLRRKSRIVKEGSPIRKGTTKDLFPVKALMRTAMGEQLLEVQLSFEKKKSIPKYLLKSFKESYPQYGNNLKYVKNTQINEELLNYENRMNVTGYKFGVLYAKGLQKSEEEFFGNVEEGKDFAEFLEFLGEKIALQGWNGYSAGLDTADNKTGTHAIHGKIEDSSIIFHVSTYLPYEKDDEQQLGRKRHIGNDIVVIIFYEPDGSSELDGIKKSPSNNKMNMEPLRMSQVRSPSVKGPFLFDPRVMSSYFNHVFLVVKKDQEVSSKRGSTYYRVGVCYKDGIEVCSPGLPPDALFEKGEAFKNWLYTKLINSESSSYSAPGFKKAIERTRKQLLQEIIDEFYPIQTGWT